MEPKFQIGPKIDEIGAMFGHVWSKKGLFGPSRAHDWRMANCFKPTSYMHVQRIAKVSVFMAGTTKKVTGKAQK